MLSVVVYGRNDAHGYNLHKRAALSLNCIASTLKNTDDEIIFVDYNTPDELPTFPEAIEDTLTAHCKSKLRILRVRPEFHKKYAGQTKLVALECQSRNIGIRRSNPTNQWILSTNTDMIFCPTHPYTALGDIAASLDDGFYHLPRFEVPEGFWERLDRQDPEAAIRAMRQFGDRYHLNEIVYGFFDNLYEGPGDFQLFKRKDIFALSGFDERMMLGWHADANIARRMKLLRGEVGTAFSHVYGYHCGHTRHATSLHRGVRVQNDQVAFVENVRTPFASWQEDTWGAPDLEVEEIRLDRQDLYLPAMSQAIPTPSNTWSEAHLDGRYSQVPYKADHVLPHLCDLLYNQPSSQRILFFGDDVRLRNGLKRFLEAAGKRPSFVLAEEGPGDGQAPDEEWAPCIAPFRAALEQADLIIIQYPSYIEGDDDLVARALCRQAFAAVVRHERGLPWPDRRRVLVVNAIHNPMASTVEAALAPASMPFSTRMRQGFVTDEADDAVSFTATELALLREVIDGLLSGAPPQGWERVAIDLLSLAEGEPAWLDLSLDPERAQAVRQAAARALEVSCGRIVDAPVARQALGAATRLCSGQDWLKPRWRRMAFTVFGHWPSRMSDRSRWTWEHLAVAEALHERLPTNVPERLGPRRPKVLVVTEEPDLIVPMLCQEGYEVTYGTVGEVLERDDAAKGWADVLATPWLETPATHRPWAPGEAEQSIEAVVIMAFSWTAPQAEQMDALLARASQKLRPDALLVAIADVQVGHQQFGPSLNFAEWRKLFEEDGPLGERGFKPVGAFDPTIPLDTVSRFSEVGANDAAASDLTRGSGESLMTSAIICAQWPGALRQAGRSRLVFSPAWQNELLKRLGRRSPFLAADQQLLTRAANGLARDRPPKDWARLAPELGAIALCDVEVRSHFNLRPRGAQKVARACEEAIRAQVADAADRPWPLGPRAEVATRLCSAADWEAPEWAEVALSVFSSDIFDLAGRSRWIWERVTLLHSLRAHFPEPSAKVLLLAPHADALSHLLAHLGYDTTCATTDEFLGISDSTEQWNERFASAWLPATAPLRRWGDLPRHAGFDAVVTTAHGLVDHSPRKRARLLRLLHSHVAPGASLHGTFNVNITRVDRDMAMPFSMWRTLYAGNGPLGSLGFTPAGEADYRIPLETAVRCANNDAPGSVPGLSFRFGDSSCTVAATRAAWPERLST